MGCKLVRITPSATDTSPDVKTKQSKSKYSSSSIDLTPTDDKAFTPDVCQQRQDAINNMAYRRSIDAWRPTSIEQLISSIQQLSNNKNQIDKAWIIFYWISQNVCYDTQSYFNHSIGPQHSENVFRSRKAVCEGYSTLYAELCTRTGLLCHKVSGYAKGFSFNPRQKSFDKTNHAWNVLTLNNGHLYFVESTWGSGHLDNATHQYKAQLLPHYFLCRPEHMIYGHLPEDVQWQLLARPLTVKQFLMLPETHEPFFESNFNIISPVDSSNVELKRGESYGEVLIKLPANDVKLSGSLKDESQSKVEGGDCVYFDQNEDLWRCRFAPQKVGKHKILIYVAKKNDISNTKTSSCAVEFVFDIDRLPSPIISYPLTWSEFYDNNLDIVKPANSRYVDWFSDENVSYCEILVRSPDDVHISTAIKNNSSSENVKNGSLVNYDAKRSLWQCLFAPSTAGASYKLTVFAKRLSNAQSHCVAQLDLPVVSSATLKNCIPFPETYGSFAEAKCHLFEPLNGILRAGSTIEFHCRIPGAHEVSMTVDGKWLKSGSTPHIDENSIVKHQITVGQKEVAVWVKFGANKASYTGLLKYTVK